MSRIRWLVGPVRSSKPYIEAIDGSSDVWAGDRVERDDGWWRAVAVTVMADERVANGYRTEIEWRPMDPPHMTGALAS